jgi:hypothetical protein
MKNIKNSLLSNKDRDSYRMNIIINNNNFNNNNKIKFNSNNSNFRSRQGVKEFLVLVLLFNNRVIK